MKFDAKEEIWGFGRQNEEREVKTDLLEEACTKSTSNLQTAFYSTIDNAIAVIWVLTLNSNNFLKLSEKDQFKNQFLLKHKKIKYVISNNKLYYGK